MRFTNVRNRFALETARRALCARSCVVASTIIASAVQKPGESDQQVLIDLERRWNEAFYSKDIAFIESVLADEFIATYDDGSRGDKAKELALAAAFNQQVESAVQDDFTVKVYRDTAVVWFYAAAGRHPAGAANGNGAALYRRLGDTRWPVGMCVNPEHRRQPEVASF